MNIVITRMKYHSVAILIAVLVGLVTVSPYLRSLSVIGDEFQGVYPTFTDDEIYYQARIHEASEGRLAVGNPYIFEHKDNSFIHPPLSEWFFAGASKLFAISAPLTTIVGSFIFPLISFLLAYILFLKITKRKSLSVFYAIAYIGLFLQTFARPVSPQFNNIFLLIGLINIYHLTMERNLDSRTLTRHSALLGFITGITFFISPYYWTAILLLFFLSSVFRFFVDKNSARVKSILYGFLPLFLTFASLYGYFTYRAGSLEGYVDATLRFGLIRSHYPGTYTSIFLITLTAIVLWFKRSLLSQEDLRFGCALLASGVILNWQNVITGQYLQFSSHYILVTILFILMVLAIIHAQTKKISFLVIGMFSVLLFFQYSEAARVLTYTPNKAELTRAQAKAPVFKWLKTHTPKDSVVYTLGGDYDFLIPIYTHNKVYYNFYAALFVMSDFETENRWLIQNLFRNDVTAEYVSQNQRAFWGNRYIDSYQFKENRKKIISKLLGNSYTPEPQIDQNLIHGLMKRYADFEKKDRLTTLNTYQVDYLFVSNEYPDASRVKKEIERMKEVKKEIEFETGSMYSFD